jgi:MoxR-like ATPase
MAVDPKTYDAAANGTPVGKVLKEAGFTKREIAEGFWKDAHAIRTVKLKGVLLPTSIFPVGVEIVAQSSEETVLAIPDLSERRKALVEVARLRNFYPAQKVELSEGLSDIFGRVLERVNGRNRGKLPSEVLDE